MMKFGTNGVGSKVSASVSAKGGGVRRAALGAAVAAALGGGLVGSVWGVPLTWTGAAGTDFNAAGNWDQNQAPAAADDIFLTAPAATNLTMALSAPTTIRTLTFTADAPGSVDLQTTNTNRLTFANLAGDNILVLGGTHRISATDSNATPNMQIKTGTNTTAFTFNIASGASLELHGRLSAGNSGQQYNKNGGGTLILSANNGGTSGWNFSNTTGGFNVNAGKLVIANNGATGNSNDRFTIANGATLELQANFGSTGANSTFQGGSTLRSLGGNRSWGNGAGSNVLNGAVTVDVVDNQLTLSQDMSGVGGIVKTGTGLLILSDGTGGVNSYTGTTAVAAGTLQLAAGASIASSRTVDVQSAGTLDVSPAGGMTVASNQTLGGKGNVVGNVTVGSGATLAPGLVGTVGTLALANDLTLSDGRVHFDLSSVTTEGGTDNDLLNVTGALNIGGPTRVTIGRVAGSLASNTTYTLANFGSMSGSEGTLVLPTVRQGLTLGVSGNKLQLTTGSGSAASLTWVGGNGGNAWDVNNTVNWSGAPDGKFFDWDNVTFTDAGAANGNVNLSGVMAPTSVTVSSGQDYTFSGGGTLSNTTLTKSGTGTLTLASADGSQFNSVAVNGGVLRVNNVISADAATVGSSGTLTLASGSASAFGTLTVNAGGTLNVGDGVSGGVGTLGTQGVTNNGTVAYNRPDDHTVAAVISGAGNVVKNGAGVVTVTGANTYTGTTTVNAGTLRVTTSASLGSTTAGSAGDVVVASGAVLDLGGNTTANQLNFGQKVFNIVGTGTGSGAIVNDGTVNQQNALQRVALTGNATVGGLARFDIRAAQVGGANVAALNLNGHTLTKTGTAQFSLVATDVTDGNIQANSGTLSIESTTAIPDLGTGTKITYNGATAQFFANAVDGDGQSLVKRPIVLAVDTVLGNASNAAATIGSPITLQGNLTTRALNANGTGRLTLQGVISGVGGITKENNGTGTNTLVLSGNNTYAGPTVVSGGTVTINGTQGNSKITIAPGATLDGNGTLTFNLAGDTGDLITNGGTFDISALDLALNITGTQTLSEYVIANNTGGTVIGSAFAAVFGLPAGGAIDYDGTDSNPNSIVLTLGPSQVPGDADGDGDVDLDDQGIWASNFTGSLEPGTGTGTFGQGDFDGDKDVDLDDQGIWASNFTGSLAPSALAAVPEPASLGVVGAAVVGLMARRRRGR